MNPPKEEKLQIVEFKDALGERYLSYALSTIMSRSLPDVRDGLKPVHRRLLYAMLELKLDPKSGYKKCARVVGDVMGKFHPHGDVAIYDTLVRLAQSFSMRYPLVDGQGNFGSIDGDNAAAMRYTEAKLTEVALLLLSDIGMGTVDFRPTYDGSEEEPVLLPSAFPNLLANGSEGIAVGMATTIPPHNIKELLAALIKIIENPDITTRSLLEIIKGPDFPTGGIIIEPTSSIINAYETGRGSFRLRARWEVEQLSHGNYQIIITEIPYQVPKARVIEKLAELFKEKKLALLGDIRDESAEDIRIILEPKTRNTDPEMLMESLFKLSMLEIRFNLNMNVLNKDNLPVVMSLKEVLAAFIDHRFVIIIRRTNYRLGKIKHRIEILDGLLICYLNLDEVIRIIREEDDAKAIMIAKFGLTEIQVEAILNMRLRSLRKLEEIEISKEHKALLEEKADLEEIIAKPARCTSVIKQEFKQLQKQFANDKRRTDFGEASDKVVSIEAFVEKEPVTIFCSKMGWIRSIRGHNEQDIKYKEGDGEWFIIKASSTDKLLIFTEKGKFFTLICDKIPKGKGYGDSVRLMIEIEADDEIINMMVADLSAKILIATKFGRGFVVEQKDVIAQTKSGKQILNLHEDDKAKICKTIDNEYLAIIGTNRKLLIFKLDEIPVMKRGRGVMLQRYRQAELSDISFISTTEGLVWCANNEKGLRANITLWLGKRGDSGKLPPSGFPKNNKFFS